MAANEAFERVASHGLQPNMILYLTKEYALPAARAANILFLWSAATNFTPIVGAFLSDSYMGRYRTIGFGSIVSLLVLYQNSLFLSIIFILLSGYHVEGDRNLHFVIGN